MDDSGHGTHVGGIIGAVGNNNKGVTGVNWDVSLMALKALNSDGVGNALDISQAIEYAKNNGADIVNCSFTGDYSETMEDAIRNASGLLFVCAAGNDGNNVEENANDVYPVCYDLDNIIGVAATDQDDNFPSYSNYGTTSIDVAAPGGDNNTNNIYSTYWTSSGSDEYSYYTGTSMSTAHVSGLAALILSRKSSLSVASLKGKIINGVDVLDSLSGKVSSGGRINAYSSLSSITTGGDSGGGGQTVCFVATAIYKSPHAWEVRKLRQFRDKYLVTNPLGKKLVHLYYKLGPSMAEFVKHHPVLKKCIKWVLDKFLYFYTKLSIIYKLGLIY